MKNNTSDLLKSAMSRHGAREYEVVALSMNADRGLAALQVAEAKGVDHPIAYAIKLFDSPDWHPSGEKRRLETNAVVEVTCATCSGDRFVFVADDPGQLYAETVKPCPSCNASVNAGFWRANGERFTVAT